MADNASLSDFQGDGGQDVMLAAYRHDAHKLNGETHDYAPDTFHGVPVNQTVPHGADCDASALSRPHGKPEQTVDNHEIHYRLSLLTGDSHYDPEEHSQSGVRPYMGSSLPDVESYDDLFLFLFRHPDHPWLLDTRPRDGLNAHDIRLQSGMPALAHETIVGRPDDARKQQQTTRWDVNAYLHADDPDILPVGEDVLDGLQFGGKRNYGYGTTTLKHTQVVDLEVLDYSRLEDGEAFILELVTPFVLRSEYPKANNVDVPWWWSVNDEAQLRHRLEKVIEGGDVSELETVDHGVFVGSDGDRPVRSGGDREERADPCWEPLEGRLRRVSSEARHSR